MRFTLVGMTVTVAIVAAALNAWAQPGQPVGQAPQSRLPDGVVPSGQVGVDTASATNAASDGSGTIAFWTPVNEKYHLLTCIYTRDRVIATYHVELLTGVSELKSVRKIEYDLKMLQFNAASPLPQEIRAKIEQLR